MRAARVASRFGSVPAAALALLLCGAVAFPVTAASEVTVDPQSLTRRHYEEDFDLLWSEIRDRYAYFDQKRTDWDRVRAIHRSKAARAVNRGAFVAALEGTLEELYDSHAHLNTNTASSPRLVPSGTDLWARWSGETAVIEEVRPSSNAERAGLRAGMRIVSINGVPVVEAVRDRMPRSLRRPDGAARDWALRALLAGRRNEPRALEVIESGKRTRIAIDDGPSRVEPTRRTRLEQRRLAGNVGYIRIHNSLGEVDLIRDFDAALGALRHTRGLILDLRDTPGGGNTTVARGILGRFTSSEVPYQRHALPEEERRYGLKRSWIELVSPRGSFAYEAPVVVLVDHWTGSMGEGIAIGLDGMGRAAVVGVEMARLLGATSGITLPNSGIGVSFPTEKLFHVNGTPRESFVPIARVDLLAATGSGDPILEAGLQKLRASPGSRTR
jgi:C-terminal processing protease CtpA/Prc